MRPVFGHIEPAIAGETSQQNFVKCQNRRGAAGADIAQSGPFPKNEGDTLIVVDVTGKQGLSERKEDNVATEKQ